MDENAEAGVAVIRPRGQLVGLDAARLKERARAALERGVDLVLALEEVTFTDSDGLGALVAIYKRSTDRGRRLLLTGVRPNLKALLELTRLHRVFDYEEADREPRARPAGAGE